MDRDALTRELEAHHQAAFGWALSCCRWDRTMAEDVLQDSYLKIVDGRARFRGHAAFRTFLFGVIRLTAANHRRRAVLRNALFFSGADGSSVGVPAGERQTADGIDVDLLRAALRALPGRQREVLHLVFYQDLTIAEAASVMRVSVGTARTHYERGKQALRAALKGARP